MDFVYLFSDSVSMPGQRIELTQLQLAQCCREVTSEISRFISCAVKKRRIDSEKCAGASASYIFDKCSNA